MSRVVVCCDEFCEGDVAEETGRCWGVASRLPANIVRNGLGDLEMESTLCASRSIDPTSPCYELKSISLAAS